MPDGFDPGHCDLCGSPAWTTLVERSGRAMRSDRVPVDTGLSKRTCDVCGLVRSGDMRSGEALRGYYASQYQHGGEHVFYGEAGPTTRSHVFADWLVGAAGEPAWQGAARVLEVGAGAGHLRNELARRFPAAAFDALEPSRESARAGGLEAGAVDERLAGSTVLYDLVYSIAVVEHVGSPTSFLRSIREHLRPGGLLLLSQPTQDVASYDVFFVDHLHHFGTPHLAAYARKCGFREDRVVVGHPLMPNFSLHVWVASDAPADFRWTGPPATTTCSGTAAGLVGDMARLDALLGRLSAQGRRVAAFGLNEVYALARCYSTLGEFALVCGFDDRPDNPDLAGCGFPVVTPERGVGLGVQDVVLTMNSLYYPAATERLTRLGFTPHPLLTTC